MISVFSRRHLPSFSNYRKEERELISGDIWAPNTPRKAQGNFSRDTREPVTEPDFADIDLLEIWNNKHFPLSTPVTCEKN